MRSHHLTAPAKLVFATLCLLAFSLAARADLITATVAITNAAGTTNGQTITLNASVRTWTNNVYTPSAQILTNSTPTGAATNLFNHLGFAPLAGTSVSYGSSTSLVVRGFPNSALTVTLSDGYGTVVYTTNTTTSAQVLRVPYSVESAAAQTNGATGLVDWLNLNAATNQLKQSAPALAQLLGTTNNQTITGNKSFRGTNDLGYIGNGTNGLIVGTVGLNRFDTNLTLLGTTHFRSGASASTDFQVHTDGGLMIYDNAAGEYLMTFTNGVVGILDSSLFMFGTSVGNKKTLVSDASGNLSLSYLQNITNATIADTFATGTNSFSDLSLRRYPITSLANGANAGVIIGTNSFVEVSGPTAAFTINGMTGSPLRDGHLVVILNQTGYDMTVAHQSGVEPTAANRIITLTGADRTTTGNGAATFLYNANTARWMLIAFDP